MIKIICDQYGLHAQKKNDFIIEEDFEYEEGLNQIEHCAHLEMPLTIIVRNPALFHWFDAPAKKYGCSVIRIDPVTELEKRFNLSALPEILRRHPEWIVELGLLQKAMEKPVLQDETIDCWLKRILLGFAWQAARPISDNDLEALFNWLITNNNRTFHFFETQLIHDQFQLWTVNCKEKKELFKWLKNEPFQRVKFLIWEQMLNRFPENRIAEWLQYDDIWFNLNLLPNRKQYLPELNLQVQFPEPITKFVHAFLEEKWQNVPKEALAFISGELEVERRFLVEQLRQQLYHGIPIEQDIYDLLTDLKKFPEVLELACQLIPAETPSKITDSSSVSDIQMWLRDEYLPFYSSCALLNRLELTEPFIAQFEKWLKGNYPSLLINGQGMAYRRIAQLKDRLPDGPVLIAVIDGLDYLSAQNDFLPVLQKHGMYPEGELIPYLSFLPTETFIAKPTLTCGWMSSQISPESPNASYYKKLLQTSFHLGDDEIIAATDLDSSLLEMVQKSSKAYLYLDNQLDREYLHTGLSPYVRYKKYRDHLKKQAENLAEAVRLVKEMFNKPLLIAVCSDHGYTVLPKHSSVINIDSGSKVKSRSMYMDNADLPDDFDEKLIWRLNPGLFGLNQEMAIPIGYSCFAKRPRGAAHGGCTPQELAVPWIVFSTHKTEPLKSLVFTIKGVIFRKREKNPLTLTISNPNNVSISITELKVSGVDITAQFPIFIEKNGVNKLAASFDASAVNANIVEFEISYRFNNKIGEMKNSVSLKVKTTGAMSTEFDDDFEF
ncbi:hypothetical protein QUF75_20140 [Desulfococcaceae bacterium HSG7]|nr:hypothetical protein [Desulfococcaceae bacterium HSG7]